MGNDWEDDDSEMVLVDTGTMFARVRRPRPSVLSPAVKSAEWPVLKSAQDVEEE